MDRMHKMSNDEAPNSIPPWRRNTPNQEPVAPGLPEDDDTLSNLERVLKTPGITWALVIGFSGGFGIAALMFVASGSLVLKNKMNNPSMWYVYAGITLVALVLWSWFLSRIRIYRSQAQDPDFGEYVEKKRKRRRSRRGREEDEEDEDEDEDEAPWL